MKGLVTVAVVSLVLSASFVGHAEESPWGTPALKERGMSIGGPTGRGAPGFGSGFAIGDVVAFKDPNGVDGYTDGVVVNTLRFINEKEDGTGSFSKLERYSILVPSKIPGGESEVYFVDTDGRIANHAPLSEYVRFVQQSLANDTRNRLTAGEAGRRQADEAGRKLDRLNEKSRKLTDRYTTASGASRLATEIAVAIAVDRAGKSLPKEYRTLGKGETAVLNAVIKGGIDSAGNATREILKDPSKDGVGEGLKAFGLTAGTEMTVGPILEQLVHDGKLAPGKAEAALKAAQAMVNVGVKAGSADAGEGLEAAEKQALDELFEALPPGTGVLAHDAAEMGFQIIEYGNVTNELRMANMNLDVSADIGNRITAARRVLGTIAEYDRLAQIRNGVFAPSAPVATASSNDGFNGGRNAETRPLANVSLPPRAGDGHSGPGAGIRRD